MSDNIETLVDRWIIDKSFRAALQRDPARAARGAGINLTTDEVGVLQAINWSDSDGALMARVSKCPGN
jgi:hypothetical protein